jgi:hypothetical protein
MRSLQGRDQLVRLGRDDRAGFDDFASGGFPFFPETGEHRERIVDAGNGEGLLVALFAPFIKAVGYDKAAAAGLLAHPLFRVAMRRFQLRV